MGPLPGGMAVRFRAPSRTRTLAEGTRDVNLVAVQWIPIRSCESTVGDPADGMDAGTGMRVRATPLFPAGMILAVQPVIADPDDCHPGLPVP